MQSAARLARDEWLALGCQRGRPEAFEALIREMERPLLYYVTKLLRDDERALDVLQEIWLYLLLGPTPAAAWWPATAGFVCLAAAVALVRWFFRRRVDDLLLEAKRLQAQGLEFEEVLRREQPLRRQDGR